MEKMSIVHIYKLAKHFQQILPGFFQESGVQDIVITRQQDREGNLFWPCFHCKKPIRDEDGLYITDEDDLENFERYVRHEETYSDEDTLSAEKLNEARAASNEFYNNTSSIVNNCISDINSLSDIDLKAAADWSGDLYGKIKSINLAFKNLHKHIEFLFSKHYYYDNIEAYKQIFDMSRTLVSQHWPYFSPYFYGDRDIKARLYEQVTDILNEAGEIYKLVNKIITIASQAAGTKKHLIQRHTINHPVCDSCHKSVGAECYVPSCNFTSPDIEDDFHEVEVQIFDEHTNKTYKENRLFCEEHGFKCDSCGNEFVSNPYGASGEYNEAYVGYGINTAFGDDYCGECFSEIFGQCEECEETFYKEDLVYDEENDREVCNNCAGSGGRQEGVEDELSSDEVAEARDFASDPLGVRDSAPLDMGFYPIDSKAIDTQILPALKKSSNKSFKTFEQFKSFLMKRIQNKDAMAAVLVETRGYIGNLKDVDDDYFRDNQEKFVSQLIASFVRQSKEASFMREAYPGLRGYKPLGVNVKVETTPGHSGHSFVIYPNGKLIEYAEMVMPGAMGAYNDFLSTRGHHRGALAYARFTKSDGKIIVDNLQTDLDSQAFRGELGDKKASKPLQWWLTAIKKFWAPFMMNLLHQYGEKTSQEIYLTSYEMQKTKWRTLPERNKDIYDRTPEVMGFPLDEINVKPEDLVRKEYQMRRVAEFKKVIKAIFGRDKSMSGLLKAAQEIKAKLAMDVS
jgi:hypothetical protein